MTLRLLCFVGADQDIRMILWFAIGVLAKWLAAAVARACSATPVAAGTRARRR